MIVLLIKSITLSFIKFMNTPSVNGVFIILIGSFNNMYHLSTEDTKRIKLRIMMMGRIRFTGTEII